MKTIGSQQHISPPAPFAPPQHKPRILQLRTTTPAPADKMTTTTASEGTIHAHKKKVRN